MGMTKGDIACGVTTGVGIGCLRSEGIFNKLCGLGIISVATLCQFYLLGTRNASTKKQIKKRIEQAIKEKSDGESIPKEVQLNEHFSFKPNNLIDITSNIGAGVLFIPEALGFKFKI